MSADLLRRAASLMRERADAATPGPWSAADEHGLLGPDASPAWCVSNMRPGYESMSPTDGYLGDVAETSLGSHEPRDQHNAEHIASWHPAVALAVADWLDSILAGLTPSGSLDWRPGGEAWHALDIARAYLGDES